MVSTPIKLKEGIFKLSLSMGPAASYLVLFTYFCFIFRLK